MSPALDAELRREARETGKTLNAEVVQTLGGKKLSSTASEYDDLDWFIGLTPSAAGDEADAQGTWLDALPVGHHGVKLALDTNAYRALGEGNKTSRLAAETRAAEVGRSTDGCPWRAVVRPS